MKAKKAVHSFKGQRTKATGLAPEKQCDFTYSGYVTGLFRKQVSWNACKWALLLAAFFDCQFLVVCPPQTWVKTRRGPGYISHQSVTYDGPDPSVLRGYQQNGFTPAPPGQSPGFDSSPAFGSQLGSDALQQMMLRPLGLNDLPGMTRVTGRVTRRPTQVQRFEESDSDDSWSDQGRWGQMGGGNANAGGWNRNGAGVGYRSHSRINSDDFAQECLRAHNEYRAKHKVPPLKLNNASALQWAQYLARLGSVRQIYHSGTDYGENIAAYRGYTVTGRTAVDDWYDEIHDYDFRRGTKKRGREDKKIGHLTQLLWKDSREVGVAVARSPNGAIFVVCQYDPAGNIDGLYTRQVPPVGGFTEEDLKRHAEEESRDPFQSYFAPMPYGDGYGGFQYGAPRQYSTFGF